MLCRFHWLEIVWAVHGCEVWCGSHFLIERCTEMDVLQTCSSTSYFNLPCWCPCSVELLCKITGVAWWLSGNLLVCSSATCIHVEVMLDEKFYSIIDLLLILYSRFSSIERRRSGLDPLVKLRRGCWTSRDWSTNYLALDNLQMHICSPFPQVNNFLSWLVVWIAVKFYIFCEKVKTMKILCTPTSNDTSEIVTHLKLFTLNQ